MRTVHLYLVAICALAVMAVHSTAVADWNPDDPFKWVQYPDLTPMGIDICVDDTGELGQRTIGDDFECTQTGPITAVHLWGSWREDVKGRIEAIHVSFYTDDPIGPGGSNPDNQWSTPDELLWERWFDASQITERLYHTLPSEPEQEFEWWWDPRNPLSLTPKGDTEVYQYNISIPDEPFIQEGNPDKPVIYWLVIEVKLDKSVDNASFGWKTRDRWDGHFQDDAVWMGAQWVDIEYPEGHEYYPDSVDMAFVLTGEQLPPDDLDFGDAPEGSNALAYPGFGVTGQFPTCINVGPAGWIQHTNFGAYFGQFVDFELDGNAGLCPMAACFPPYDQDECFQDADAGLMYPEAFTIDAAYNIVTCTGNPPTSLGQTCTLAAWGTNLDIFVTNNMPNNTTGYVNVLMDWNRDGQWGGGSACPTGVTPEHVLVDFPVPNGHSGPLSNLLPPSFMIGPNFGHVWTRFSITERPVGTKDWDGSGQFEDGETEDYLLRIEPYEPDELDFGDAPEFNPDGTATGFPTTLANNGPRHIISPNIIMGGLIDPEPDGQPTTPADGDDLANLPDEDGVAFTTPLIPGQPANVDVTVSAPGFLNAWVDFVGNADWNDAGEQICTDLPVNPGLNSIPYNVPAAAAPGPAYARFRFTTYANAPQGYVGQANDGEVEDYRVDIEKPDRQIKFQQLPLDGAIVGDERYFGHDELSAAYRNPEMPSTFLGCYMADDFADLKSTPVIRVTWWGSYLENEIMDPGVNRFLIAFESDIPAFGEPGTPDYEPSRPGEVLQTQFVHLAPVGAVPNPGEYTETFVSQGGPPCNEALFRYDAVLRNPFCQDPNTVYWIKIVAMVDVDPPIWAMLLAAAANAQMSECEFLNLPFAQQQQFGLEIPVTRWGWHNRDYTQVDPYASVPPAVVPGEHIAGILFPGTMLETPVWHFQDDAVAGEIFIDEAAPEMPFVDQRHLREEYYRFFWPLCPSITPHGVDGPEEIEQYSKDLAFELHCCACLGDIDGTPGVNINDLNILIMHILNNGNPGMGYQSPIAGYECADVAPTFGVLDINDLNTLIMHILTNGDPTNGYASPCYVIP